MDRDVGVLDTVLDDDDRPREVPCEGPGGVGVYHSSEDVGSRLLAQLVLVVSVHTGHDLSVVLDRSVDSQDVLCGHSHGDVGLGEVLPHLLHSLEGGDELGISR